MPNLFCGDGYDNTTELMDYMKTNFRPVSLPVEILNRKMA